MQTCVVLCCRGDRGSATTTMAWYHANSSSTASITNPSIVTGYHGTPIFLASSLLQTSPNMSVLRSVIQCPPTTTPELCNNISCIELPESFNPICHVPSTPFPSTYMPSIDSFSIRAAPIHTTPVYSTPAHSTPIPSLTPP